MLTVDEIIKSAEATVSRHMKAAKAALEDDQLFAFQWHSGYQTALEELIEDILGLECVKLSVYGEGDRVRERIDLSKPETTAKILDSLPKSIIRKMTEELQRRL